MNLSKKLEETLDHKFLDAIKIISQSAKEFCVKAYIIGGVVRDLILQKPIYDIDIVIEGNAVDFCKFIESKNLCKITRIANDFGTAKVLFPQIDNLCLDFASTRTEVYPIPGHLPVIEKIGCPLKDDILRRDFTVNALALSINEKDFGTLIDYTGGLKDITQKKLKILHDKSFIDDPTRIIRALRFSNKLDFSLEQITQKKQNEYLEKFDNNDICYERIKQVLKLAFNINNAKLYNDFIQSKIYKIITTTPLITNGEIIFDNIQKNITHISNENIWLIYLTCCINSNDAKKLNLSSKELSIITTFEKFKMDQIDFNNNFELYKFFFNLPIESIVAFDILTEKSYGHKFITKLKNIKPEINGYDLIKIGFPKSEIIGKILLKILEEKINGNLKSKEEELIYAKKNFFMF